MATNNYIDQPIAFRAIHPGEILREELRERNIKQKNFALQIGIQASHLNEFIKGKRNLNPDWAQHFEKALGIPYQSWMNLQNAYIYDAQAIAQRDSDEQINLAYEQQCKQIVNLPAIYKHLGINDFWSTQRVARLKTMFPFDLLTIKEHPELMTGLYNHSEKAQLDEYNMLTWLAINWWEISRATLLTTYRHDNALKAAEEIAHWANKQQLTINSIRQCLHSYGILYLEVSKLDKAPNEAYSTICHHCPIITVTYRYNDMDKLAFDLLHELCHIHYHFDREQQGFISIEGSEYSNDPKEREANDFARKTLIPDTTWRDILKVDCHTLNPHKIVTTIATRAIEHGISPSIAVARYKHDTHWYKTAAHKSPKIR